MRRFLLLLILISAVLFTGQQMMGVSINQQMTITPDTVTDLQMLERYGQGSMNEVLAFSPVDERIVVGGKRGIFLFENLDAEAQLIEFFHEDGSPFNVTSLLFSHDGNLIFAGNGETVIAYDLLENTKSYSVEAEEVLSLSRDGSQLLYETVYGVTILDTATGRVLRELSYEGIWEDDSSVTNNVVFARFMADSERIIVHAWHIYNWGNHGGSTSSTDIWTDSSYSSAQSVFDFVPPFADAFIETDDGFAYALYEGDIYGTDETIQALGDDDSIFYESHPAFSADGTIFATRYVQRNDNNSRDSLIGIWQAETLEQLAVISVEGSTTSLTLNEDMSLLAVGRKIYDVATGELLRTFATKYELINSQYERIFHYDGGGNIRLLDAVTMNELSIVAQANQFTSYPRIDYDNPEIMWLPIDGDNGLRGQRRVSLETGTVLGDFSPEAVNYYQRTVSQNNAYIVFDDYETIGEIWHLESANRLELPEDTVLVEPYFTENNLLLLYHRQSSEIWFYDLETGSPVTTILIYSVDSPMFYHLVFSVDGQRMLLVHYSREARSYLATVYDIDNENLIKVYETETKLIESDMSGDGTLLAVMSDRDTNEVSIIDIENDEILVQEPLDYFPDSLSLGNTTLLVEFWDDWVDYNWESGELLIKEPSSEQYPILRTDTMLFYRDDDRVLRITATDGMTLHEIDMGRYFYPIVLSDDGQRLWIKFTDSTVELWGIQG